MSSDLGHKRAVLVGDHVFPASYFRFVTGATQGEMQLFVGCQILLIGFGKTFFGFAAGSQLLPMDESFPLFQRHIVNSLFDGPLIVAASFPIIENLAGCAQLSFGRVVASMHPVGHALGATAQSSSAKNGVLHVGWCVAQESLHHLLVATMSHEFVPGLL